MYKIVSVSYRLKLRVLLHSFWTNNKPCGFLEMVKGYSLLVRSTTVKCNENVCECVLLGVRVCLCDAVNECTLPLVGVPALIVAHIVGQAAGEDEADQLKLNID